jgi:hypothetical protein
MVLSSIKVSTNMDLETKQQFIKDVITECEKVLGENCGNRCAKYCKEYLDSKDGQDLDAKGKLESNLGSSIKSLTNTHFPNATPRLDDLLQVHQDGPQQS